MCKQAERIIGITITVAIFLLILLMKSKADMRDLEGKYQISLDTTNNLTMERDYLEKDNYDLLQEVTRLNEALKEVEADNKSLREEVRKKVLPSRGSHRGLVSLGEFEVTAYDLSVDSCGKKPGDKYYGITATGINLIGKTYETARVIAVDPKAIPKGEKVYLKFIDEQYSKYNGWYTAGDTGGAIKGKIVDLFLGDFNSTKSSPIVKEFGRRQAIIYRNNK